jgi:signal transduction histidine kinase
MDAASVGEALPTIAPGTHEYDVFASGETDVVADYAEVDGALGADDSPGTVIMIPLGEYGMLHVGATGREPPDDVQLDLIRILSRNAQAALTATTREAELAASKAELERSNEALQQFAYIASHDLQEPLRMVSSYIDLLDSEYGDELDEEAQEYMHYAVDGATRMKEMIDGLLAYSRVETKGSDPEPVDPESVLETTLRELSLYLDDTDMTVEYGELPMVRADPTQLGQVFQNLIKNAAEHGDATAVEIGGAVSSDHVTLTVTDDGTGIPEADRDRVFDIFEQSHDAEGGSGIGLAVCERIVARHGGEIGLGSGSDGGAQFTIQLPRGEEGAA